MATMIVELYEALKAAGAPEEHAQAAAKALANTDERFNRLDVELAAVKSELAMVKWIVSSVGFGVLLLVLRSFWPA